MPYIRKLDPRNTNAALEDDDGRKRRSTQVFVYRTG
jgi:hypothetical protein